MIYLLLVQIHLSTSVVLQLTLMQSVRESIAVGQFPQFVNAFLLKMFPSRKFPSWVVEALASVNIKLECSVTDS